MEISGSVALVTGANRGLGAHFVDGLVASGAARIYACARDPATLAPLTARHGEKIVALRLDVTKQAEIDAAAAQASDVTMLINNAGVLENRGLVEAGGLDSLGREMAVNVFGLAAMALAFAPVIEANRGGAIVNMLSVASLQSFPPFGSYSATKAAAMSLTQCLRYELKDRGIAVFGVHAGLIDTGMADFVDDDKAAPRDIVDAALAGVAAGIPDIDADNRAKDVRAGLRADPAALEASFWERADKFRQAHPIDRD